jgi:hypothetical protein
MAKSAMRGSSSSFVPGSRLRPLETAVRSAPRIDGRCCSRAA